MAHIHLVGPEDARGRLKEIYDAAIARAGKVFNIVRTMSPNPPGFVQSEFAVLDLVRLPNYSVYVRLLVDGTPQIPFGGATAGPSLR